MSVDWIALRRLRLLPVPRGPGLPRKHKLTVLAELAALGYTVRGAERLDAADPTFLEGHKERVDALVALRGGDVDYVPLFLGFPDDVPDEDEYFARRVIGYLGNHFGLFPEAAGPRLESGMVIPTWLFELRAFGADPVTQQQSSSLFARARRLLSRRTKDRHVEWIDLELVYEDELDERLRGYLQAALYARSSIKEELHDDLKALLVRFGPRGAGVDCERISVHETKALVLRAFWEAGDLAAVSALAKTPTDVLRLCAALTGTDVSLATKARFPKLTRAQRRALLSIVDASPAPAEDLNRYRGLWLEFGRYLHPGEHRERFPRAAAAFDQLRADTVTTFEGATERLLARGDLPGVLEHLRRRPGVLARRLHELLRVFPRSSAAVLAAFEHAAASMTLKSLLTLHAYFGSINEQERRTVINKRGRIKILENNARGALTPPQIEATRALLWRAMVAKLSTGESWAGKRVWIDPALVDYTVPLQQRAASDGLVTFGRGSRIAVDFDKVLRLFVYWKEHRRRTDLDLSLIQFHADFSYAGHVSYTRLADAGIVHSGDLQSAPHGAAEFIDVTLSALPKNVRFVAVQIYRYCGDSFTNLTAHAGWMVRADVDARYKTFDIKTVANKFDLNGAGDYCVPLIVDMEARKIVLVDLYMSGRAFYNNVEGSYGNVALACRELAQFTETRPTMDTLARVHAEGRGAALTSERADADITFGTRDGTYRASDVEGVLATLL